MALKGYFGPDGYRPIQYRFPPMPTDQAELRRYRRNHRHLVYTEKFVLSTEVAAVAGPLAERLAPVASKAPRAAREAVREFVDGLHAGLAETVVRWTAEADAKRRTRHLKDRKDDRRASIKHLLDIAQRPTAPVVDDSTVSSGRWAEQAAAMFTAVDAPLAEILRTAHRPDAPELRGLPALSDELVTALRTHLDRPAAELEQTVAKIERHRPYRPAPTKPNPEAARAELARLGVEAP